MFHVANQPSPQSQAIAHDRVRTTFATSPLATTFSPLLFAGDADAAIRNAHELGFDGVDLSLRDPSEPAITRFADAVIGSRLKIGAIGTGQSYTIDGLALVDGDPSKSAQLESRFRGILELAARYETQVIVGGLRGRLAEGTAERKEQYSRAVKRLREFSTHAHSLGVTLLIEPLNRYESNFVNTVQEAIVLIADTDSPNLGIVLDMFHMNIEEPVIHESVRLAGDRLRHVQLSDSNRRAPGFGHVNFGPVTEALQAIRYSGFFSAEVVPWPSSHEAARQAIGFLRNL